MATKRKLRYRIELAMSETSDWEQVACAANLVDADNAAKLAIVTTGGHFARVIVEKTGDEQYTYISRLFAEEVPGHQRTFVVDERGRKAPCCGAWIEDKYGKAGKCYCD